MQNFNRKLPENLRARFEHYHENNTEKHWLRGKKRITLCIIEDKETKEVVSYGVAACGKHDVPVRKLGNDISYNRAIKDVYHAGYKVQQ